MAKQYVIIGPDGSSRISDSPGNANVVGTDPKGESSSVGGGWNQFAGMAGMAGGGLLAYWLANKMFGSSDEERKKGKKPGLLRSLIPYLAAAGGAIGGHYLLSGAGGKPSNNDIAVELDENGKVKPIDKSKLPSGTGWYVGAGLGGAAGTTMLARGAGNAYRVRHDLTSLLDRVAQARAEHIRATAVRGASSDMIDKALKKVQEAEANYRAAAASVSSPDPYHRFMRWLGKEAPRTPGASQSTVKYLWNSPRWMGGAGATTLGLSALAGYLGHQRNSDLADITRRMREAGIRMD